MSRFSVSIALGAVLFLTYSLAGCGSKPPANPPTAGHGEHDDGLSGMQKMKAELAKLSPEDAASAEKQHVCPVSGEMIGTMGAPQKIDVNGKQVWICCNACKDKLLANPDEFLTKLK